MQIILERLEYDAPFTGERRVVRDVTPVDSIEASLRHIGSEMWQVRLADVRLDLTDENGREPCSGPRRGDEKGLDVAVGTGGRGGGPVIREEPGWESIDDRAVRLDDSLGDPTAHSEARNAVR